MGKRVVITGSDRGDLNGKTRVPTAYNKHTGMYTVRVDGSPAPNPNASGGGGGGGSRAAATPDAAETVQLKYANMGPPVDLVTVGTSGRVIKLHLGNNKLKCKQFPSSALYGLTLLQELDLSDNPGLLGEIPDTIVTLSFLKVLNLSGCPHLRGTIPVTTATKPGIATLTFLERLYLNGCGKLTGSIPTEIGTMSSLKVLDLKRCEGLRGAFPDLSQLSQLRELHCGGCIGLTGEVDGLLPFGALEVLSLAYCIGLEGPLPLGPLQGGGGMKLRVINFEGASGLSGEIPSVLQHGAILKESQRIYTMLIVHAQDLCSDLKMPFDSPQSLDAATLRLQKRVNEAFDNLWSVYPDADERRHRDEQRDLGSVRKNGASKPNRRGSIGFGFKNAAREMFRVSLRNKALNRADAAKRSESDIREKKLPGGNTWTAGKIKDYLRPHVRNLLAHLATTIAAKNVLIQKATLENHPMTTEVNLMDGPIPHELPPAPYSRDLLNRRFEYISFRDCTGLTKDALDGKLPVFRLHVTKRGEAYDTTKIMEESQEVRENRTEPNRTEPTDSRGWGCEV